jgi:hypothetical protein
VSRYQHASLDLSDDRSIYRQSDWHLPIVMSFLQLHQMNTLRCCRADFFDKVCAGAYMIPVSRRPRATCHVISYLPNNASTTITATFFSNNLNNGTTTRLEKNGSKDTTTTTGSPQPPRVQQQQQQRLETHLRFEPQVF